MKSKHMPSCGRLSWSGGFAHMYCVVCGETMSRPELKNGTNKLISDFQRKHKDCRQKMSTLKEQ